MNGLLLQRMAGIIAKPRSAEHGGSATGAALSASSSSSSQRGRQAAAAAQSFSTATVSNASTATRLSLSSSAGGRSLNATARKRLLRRIEQDNHHNAARRARAAFFCCEEIERRWNQLCVSLRDIFESSINRILLESSPLEELPRRAARLVEKEETLSVVLKNKPEAQLARDQGDVRPQDVVRGPRATGVFPRGRVRVGRETPFRRR